MVTEADIRSGRIERPEPPADVLDRLAAKGHDRHGFCQRCWDEAFADAQQASESQADAYLRVLAAAEESA